MHGPELGGEPQDAQSAGDRQATDDCGQGRGDRSAEHKEQHHGDQWHNRQLGAFLVGADSARQLAGQWVQPGQFDVAVVDFPQVRLDDLVILQNRVVVVALERHADEGVLQVLRLHLVDEFVGGVRGFEPTHPADYLIRVILDHLVQFPGDLLLPRLVGDLLVIRRRQDGDDVAGSVTAVDLVAQQRRLDRLTALIVETTLRDVLSETGAEEAAT